MRRKTEGACRECGGPYMQDPYGADGVLVHINKNYEVDFETDLDHVPVPEEDE